MEGVGCETTFTEINTKGSIRAVSTLIFVLKSLFSNKMRIRNGTDVLKTQELVRLVR